jgi:hypothetical protein
MTNDHCAIINEKILLSKLIIEHCELTIDHCSTSAPSVSSVREALIFASFLPAGPGPDRGRGRQVRLCGESDLRLP